MDRLLSPVALRWVFATARSVTDDAATARQSVHTDWRAYCPILLVKHLRTLPSWQVGDRGHTRTRSPRRGGSRAQALGYACRSSSHMT